MAANKLIHEQGKYLDVTPFHGKYCTINMIGQDVGYARVGIISSGREFILFQFRGRGGSKIRRRSVFPEQTGCYDIDHAVRALCGKNCRHQKLKRIRMFQRAFLRTVDPVQFLIDSVDFFFFSRWHAGSR